MIARSVETMLNQAQIDHLSTLCFINKIDEHVNIVSAVRISTADEGVPVRTLLVLEIYFLGDKVSEMSFDLHNYDYDDIVTVAKNLRSNDFIMQAVDNHLAGDIE
jgi:hypothetical protein